MNAEMRGAAAFRTDDVQENLIAIGPVTAKGTHRTGGGLSTILDAKTQRVDLLRCLSVA